MTMKLRYPFLAAFLFFTPCAASAQPVSVVLYPTGALVTEEEVFRPTDGRLTLQIPAGADEGSLEFSLSKGSVTGTTSVLREGVPSAEVGTVRSRLSELENEAALLSARRESVAQERRFWSSRSAPSESLEAQTVLAAKVAEQLERLAVRDAGLAASLREIDAERKALEKRLADLGPQNGSVRECALEVADAGRAPVRVRWSYFLNDAGWQPRYRVQALQEKGEVVIAMDAVIRQGSGMNWKDVEVSLSSSEDFRSVTPPVLPDWIIGEEPGRMMPRSANLLASRAPVADHEAAFAKASATSHASGLYWKLGSMDIPAGAETARPVDSHAFSATFFRLVRPMEDSRAWIAARLEENASPLLPAGQASFVVDGVENSRGVFGITPGDHEIFFGVDQLVSVKTSVLPARGADCPAGMKVSEWRWNMDIVNGHDQPVNVRVEAVAPVLRNPRMSVKTKSRPGTELNEEGSRYEWNLEMAPGKTTTIVHEVTVTTPSESLSEKK